jgi:hypothetical protein
MSNAQKESEVDFEAVKRLSLMDFLSVNLNVTPKKFGANFRMSSCPACGDADNSGSTRLSISKDDRTYKCFSCGDHGSILDAAMKLWGCSLVEAGRQLLGVSHEYSASKPKIDRSAAIAEAAAKTANMRKAFSLLQLATAKFKDEAVPLNYLVNERKIPLELVRKAQARGLIGFLPSNSVKATDVLLATVGEDLLRVTELWKPDKKLPGIAYRPLVFFMPNLSSAEFRLTEKDIPKDWVKSIRYGTLEYPYWWTGSDAQCMIVEGAIDMLSAVALGFKGHVLGLPGCNTFVESWFPAAAKRYDLKRFVIALDNDVDSKKNPGQLWANKLKEVLTGMDLPCFIKAPASGDLNDILKARSA